MSAQTSCIAGLTLQLNPNQEVLCFISVSKLLGHASCTRNPPISEQRDVRMLVAHWLTLCDVMPGAIHCAVRSNAWGQVKQLLQLTEQDVEEAGMFSYKSRNSIFSCDFCQVTHPARTRNLPVQATYLFHYLTCQWLICLWLDLSMTYLSKIYLSVTYPPSTCTWTTITEKYLLPIKLWLLDCFFGWLIDWLVNRSAHWLSN